jgi:hypothetical protein
LKSQPAITGRLLAGAGIGQAQPRWCFSTNAARNTARIWFVINKFIADPGLLSTKVYSCGGLSHETDFIQNAVSIEIDL